METYMKMRLPKVLKVKPLRDFGSSPEALRSSGDMPFGFRYAPVGVDTSRWSKTSLQGGPRYHQFTGGIPSRILTNS
jgi:hypothetical protein